MTQLEEDLKIELGKEKEKNKDIETAYILQKDLFNDGYISKDKIREALNIGEDKENVDVLELIKTLVAENNRLEDIEDRKVQIEYELVFNKGVKSVKDKIKEEIKELEILADEDKGNGELYIRYITLKELLEGI